MTKLGFWGLGVVSSLPMLGCSSATPDATTPTAEATASAEALPSVSASASAEPAPSGYVPVTTGAVVDCFCAAWDTPANRGEVCTDGVQKCMRRKRLVDEALAPGECLPQKRERCTGYGCEGETCYRLR